MPTQFNGRLNPNEIFGAIYNMIISQQVFADNIKGTSPLVAKYKTEGSMYGDTKLFYSTDVLSSRRWGADAEAPNLLAINRPASPKCQAIVLDQFRQIDISVDHYLTKRAWGTEDSFSQFTAVMLGWIGETKRVYDSRLLKVFVGTHETSIGNQSISITLPQNANPEVENRLQAQTIAQEIADVFDSLTLDETREYNNYGYLRSYNKDDFDVIWNTEYLNKFRYIDLPTVFHKDGIDSVLTGEKLVSRYFGRVNTSGGTTAAQNNTIRSMIETDYGNVHVFPGDLLPGATQYLANETYTPDDTVICKIVHKNAIKYMSAFETATMFFNPRSLTENHYLTWGFSAPTQLDEYSFITIRGVEQ